VLCRLNALAGTPNPLASAEVCIDIFYFIFLPRGARTIGLGRGEEEVLVGERRIEEGRRCGDKRGRGERVWGREGRGCLTSPSPMQRDV
jgi:hypothetical protein